MPGFSLDNIRQIDPNDKDICFDEKNSCDIFHDFIIWCLTIFLT